MSELHRETEDPRPSEAEKAIKQVRSDSFWRGLGIGAFIGAIAMFGLVIAVVATTDDSRELRQPWTTFSADVGGTVEKTCEKRGGCYYRGCLFEPTADGGERCRVEWLYDHWVKPHYTPPDDRWSDERVAARACVFVETDDACFCRPFWYWTWTRP